MFAKIDLIKVLARQIGVQSNCYVMCMDGFSLAKLCSFAKFTILSPAKHPAIQYNGQM